MGPFLNSPNTLSILFSPSLQFFQTLTSLPAKVRKNWRDGENKMERVFGEFRKGTDGKQEEYVDWEESEMVGFGDYRGHYPINEDSNYMKMINKVTQARHRDPTLKGKFLTKARSQWYRFCCDTGSSCYLLPARIAALNGLQYTPLDPDEPSYSSVTNHRLTIL